VLTNHLNKKFMNDIKSCHNYCRMVFISENDEEPSHNFAMPRSTGVKIHLSLVAMTIKMRLNICKRALFVFDI